MTDVAVSLSEWLSHLLSTVSGSSIPLLTVLDFTRTVGSIQIIEEIPSHIFQLCGRCCAGHHLPLTDALVLHEVEA